MAWLSVTLITHLTLLVVPQGVSASQQTPEVNGKSNAQLTTRCSSIWLNDTWNDTLIQRFRGCNIVEGNVEVTSLSNSLPYMPLSVLANISEITGYLRLENLGNLTELPMPLLRLVRGQQTVTKTLVFSESRDYSVIIGNASELDKWPFPQLQEISSGDMLLYDAPKLCNVDTIDWEDIQNRRVNGVVTHNVGRDGNAFCQACKESCGGYCWSAQLCQTRSLKSCSSACAGRRCLGTGVFDCCDSQCVGGCYAVTDNTQCVGCKTYQNSNTCVDKCPSLDIYDSNTFQYVPNPDARYILGSQCVLQCPDTMFRDGQVCVDSCPAGKYSNDSMVCLDCNGVCPKDCVGGDFNSTLLENLTNCTRIMTYLKISRSDALAKDLEVLASVRYIHQYLEVSVVKTELKSLSFLRNLEEIAGTVLDVEKFALTVVSNDYLEELGLNSLRKIHNGKIIVNGNDKLCLSVTNEQLVAAGVINSSSDVIFFSSCGSQTLCHSQCNVSLGCWGAGDNQCLACQAFDDDGTCVANCTAMDSDRLLVANAATKKCDVCHKECAVGCSGVNPDDCVACKHVQDGPFCRPRCPPTKYANSTGHCTDCNAVCKDGCSGSGIHMGRGGCKNCELFLLNDNETSVVECVARQSGCPAHKYAHVVSEPANHPFILRHVCRECDPLCTACSGAGPGNCGSSSNCLNASNDDICVASCPIKKYLSPNGTCELCPLSCGEAGCQLITTNTSSGCGKSSCGTENTDNTTNLLFGQVECISCPYISIINGSRVCVATCQADQPIVNASNHVCLDHCYQLSYNINGTNFCSSECPDEKPLLYRNSSECHEQCPDDTFVASARHCNDCASECQRRDGKPTCINGSSLIGSCLNGCKNFREDEFCVTSCTEDRVAITEGPGHPTNSDELSQKCVPVVGDVTTGTPISTLSTTAVAPSANLSLAVSGEESDDLIYIIAGASGGGGLLLLLLIIIVCCVRCRRSRKRFSMEETSSIDFILKPLQNGKKVRGNRKLTVINEKQLEKQVLLENGAFGSVYKGNWLREVNGSEESSTVAIRVLNEGSLRVSGKKQLEVLASFGHPQVVTLFGVCTTSNFMVISEFVPLGPMASFLRNHRKVLFGQDLLSFSKQVVEGLIFLEAIKIPHRNLSARSVFVDTPTTVKVGDIALPAITNVDDSYFGTDGPTAPSKWFAPECFQQHQFSHKSDTWAFGVTLWEIMTLGNQPYKGIEGTELLGLLKDGHRLPVPFSCSKGIYSIMLQCWNIVSANRPGFQQLMQELDFASENTADHVNTPADIEKKNVAAGHEPANVYIEIDTGCQDENDDDGYNSSAGSTFSPGKNDDWYTAMGMYISPLTYSARDEHGVPIVSLSPNPMYGGGSIPKDRPSLTARNRENVLYVSASSLKSDKSTMSNNVLYDSVKKEPTTRL